MMAGMNKMIGVIRDRVARTPLLMMITLTALGLVCVLLSQLFRAPGISFALSVNTRHVELRLGQSDILLRDINTSKINVELAEGEQAIPPDNNLLNADVVGNSAQFLLNTEGDGVARLETLLIKKHSLVTLTQLARENVFQIKTAHEALNEPRGLLRLGWDGAVDLQAPAELPVESNTAFLPLDDVDIALHTPEMPASLAPPFPVTGIRLMELDDNPIRPYKMSTVLEGRLQFFSYGVPLPASDIEPGMLLHIAGLAGEVTNLSGTKDGLQLRLYGVAEDIQIGFGSTMGTTYPTAFEGLSALPSVRVAITTAFGVLIAMIGAVAIQSRLDPTSEPEIEAEIFEGSWFDSEKEDGTQPTIVSDDEMSHEGLDSSEKRGAGDEGTH